MKKFRLAAERQPALVEGVIASVMPVKLLLPDIIGHL